MVCKQCNTEYVVLIEEGGPKMIDAEELDIELPYCPMCGEEDWRDSFEDDVDL